VAIPWIVRFGSIVLVAVCALRAQVTLTGRVVDENDAPVANARVLAHKAQQRAVETYSGPAGAFRISLPQEGEYLVSAESVGYFRLKDRPVQVEKRGTEITLVLNAQREVFQSVEVGDSPSPVDPARSDREQRLSGTEINDIPYPASNSLRNAMRLTPGVIQDHYTPNLYAYNLAFTNQQYNYSAAVSFVLGTVAFLASYIFMLVVSRGGAE